MKSELSGFIGILCLFLILTIGAIGQVTYQEQPKHPEPDRSKASRQAVYTNNDFEKSLDQILMERGK